MPFIRYPTKRAAKRAQRAWFLGVAKFEILARILETVPRAGFGAVASDVIAISMGYLAIEAGSAADDPPRSDFMKGTRARRRGVPVDKLGESHLERQAASFADDSTYGAAYLAAFVRAVERSQMAEEVRALEALAARLAEADIYADRASASVRQASEQGHLLATTLAADTALRETTRDGLSGPMGERLLATPLWEQVGPSAARLFREGGVDPSALASDWDPAWADDPLGSCAATLLDAVGTSGSLSDALQSWGPEQDRPETPDLSDIS